MVDQRSVQLGTVGQEPTVPATMRVEDERFCLYPEKWVEEPQQVNIEHKNGHQTIHFGNRAAIVADFQPRPLWGVEDGRPFTVLDAQMSVDGAVWSLPAQIYKARSILWDAHIEGPYRTGEAVRATFSLGRPAWVHDEPVTSEQGTLGPWSDGNKPGLTWEPPGTHTLHELTERLLPLLTTLFNLWTGGPVGVSALQVRLENAGWCIMESAQDPPAAHRHSFLGLNKLTLELVTEWLAMAHDLGPLPFLAVADGTNLQPDAQMLATALEGLHRRLHPDTRRFQTPVSRADLKRARQEASRAAVAALEGKVDAAMAKKVFDEALGHVEEPSYAERLAEILPAVAGLAPGLLGPSLPAWIKDMKDLRNIQSHGLQNHDDFGEAEISRYYVMASSGRWALKILLLLELIDEDQVRSALYESDQFMFALANIDREGHWNDFSSYEEFVDHLRESSH